MAPEPAIEAVIDGLKGRHHFQAAYNFYGVRVRIRSDSQGPLSSLDSVYSFFSKPGVTDPHLEMTLLVNGGGAASRKGKVAFARVPSGFDGWRTPLLYRNGLCSGARDVLSHIREIAVPPQQQEDGKRLYYISDISDIPCWSENWMAGVEYFVFLFVMNYLPHLCAVHAGTVGRDGQGILLCGSSNSGKSVLSYALARQGFAYLSDEFGLFAPTSLEVYPFPRGISFKPEAVRLFPELGPILEGDNVVWRQEKRHLVSVDNLGFQVNREPVRAAFVFFVRYQASAVPRLTRVAPGDAAERLVNSGNFWLHTPVEARGFTRTEAALRLCENAVCAELLSGDLDRTAALVTSVVDNGL